MSSLSTGLSALSASQRALDIIGQNIANANTPGYHRQVVNLAARIPAEDANLSIGTGVEITDVRRLHSDLLESALTQHTFGASYTTTTLQTLRQVESLLAPGEGSIHDTLERFFNQLEQLSARPDDMPTRRVLLGVAAALSDQFNFVAGEFGRMQSNHDLEISNTVAEVNGLAEQVAQLNAAIQRSEVRGIHANDLIDRRDQLINDLATRIDLRTVKGEFGQVNVFLEGVPLVLADAAIELESKIGSDGLAAITVKGSKDALAVTGGRLGALLELRNVVVPQLDNTLDTLAHEFIRNVNRTHASGIGLVGPFTYLAGDQAVSNTTVPLAQAGLAFAPQAGSLFVSVTNQATGQRTLTEVAIDPSTQSLEDVAAAISAVPNLQAIVEPQTQTLRILAATGYTFDFSGRLETTPDASGITGTATPSIGGTYSGTINDTFTFRVVGGGTVGVTPSLTMQVENAAGSVIATLNIGQGYEPGSSLVVAKGVTVQLSPGTLTSGDTFSTRVVAQSDSAGILGALGINQMFDGSTAADIRVNPDLIASPERLAASRSGQPGDGSNLKAMAALRDQKFLANGTQTLRGGYATLVSDVGSRVQSLTERQGHEELLGLRLESEREGLSGVDPNEELVRMVQFQRSFQMAARFIRTVSETLDELVRLV